MSATDFMMMATRHSGFTLIEMMVTVAVLVVLGLTVVPSVQRMVERNRIVATVEAVYAQVALAKGESYKRSEQIVVRVVDSDGAWGVGVSDVAACDPLETDPTQADACTLPFTEADGSTTRVLRAINNTMYTADRVEAEDEASDSTIQTFTFDPTRGTVTPPGEIEVDYAPADDREYEVRVLVDATGRIRVCSQAGDAHVGRYPDTNCDEDD